MTREDMHEPHAARRRRPAASDARDGGQDPRIPEDWLTAGCHQSWFDRSKNAIIDIDGFSIRGLEEAQVTVAAKAEHNFMLICRILLCVEIEKTSTP